MSFKRETDPVLTGSLNLNHPSALIPAEDAVGMENWRVDAAGALRSRLDQASVSDAGQTVHTLHTRLPSTRYTGAGGILQRNGSTITTGFDGAPLGVADMYGYTWIMNRAKQGRDSGAGFEAWAPTAPAEAPGHVGPDPGGELVLGQTYYYWITFVDDQGQETNPSPEISIDIVDEKRFVSITTVGVTIPAHIVGWNVYRGGNTLPQPYRLNAQTIDIALNFYADDGGYHQGGNPEDLTGHSDEGLVKLGIPMQTDADPPPPARGLVGPYYDRLIAYSTAARPNWLFWSRISQPSFFPGSEYDEGNHVPVGDDGENIVRVIQHSRHLRIYKQSTIWRLAGDPGADDSVLELANPDIGLVAANAIVAYGDLDFFEASEGIYVNNGYSVKKISGKLDPLFKGDVIGINGARPTVLMNRGSGRSNNTLAICNGRLYFSYASYASSWPDTTLVYDIETGRWSSDDRGFNALYYEGQAGAFLGAQGSAVYSLEQPQTSSIDLYYQTGYRDQGQRDHQKTYADVVVEYTVNAASAETLTVKAVFDEGGALQTIGTLQTATPTPPASGRRRDVFKIETNTGKGDGYVSRTCAVRIDGSVVNPVVIHSIDLHYYLHARDALTFDSDKTHLGYQGVKALDMIELDIDSTGSTTWSLSTDRPGGTMAERSTAAIAATEGRQSIQLPLDADKPEGRLVRLLLTSASTFRVYGCRIRYRKIGMYLDEGEKFITLELAG